MVSSEVALPAALSETAEALFESAPGPSATLERVARASMAIAEAANDLSRDERAMLSEVLEHASLAMGAELAAIGIGNDPTQPFALLVTRGTDPGLAARLGSARPVGVLGAVMQGGTSIRLRDVREHVAFRGVPPGHPSVTSFLGVPLRARGETVGTLYLANKEGGLEFTASDECVATVLATQVGTALWNRRLYAALAGEQARLELIASSSAALSQSLDVEGTLQHLTDATIPKLGDACIVWVVDDDGRMMRASTYAHVPAVDAGVLRAYREIGSLSVGEQGMGDVVRTGESRSIQIDERFLEGNAVARERAALLRALAVKSLLAVPIVVDGHVLGVLSLASLASHRYAPEDVALAEELGRRAGLALLHARLYREARDAARARDEVLAIVSHDLRNPLNVIFLEAATLARGLRGEERAHCDAIRRAATRMDTMIHDLLNAAVLDAGELSLSPAREAVSALVNEAVEAAAPLAHARSIELTHAVGEALPSVLCDRDRTLQALANLLGNAIKFARPGGRVRLDVQQADGAIRFAVTDDGPGVAEDERPHLFDRYWKGRHAGTNGIGLGLHIAKGIVDAHGGHIGVESRVGSGSTFFFTLPIDGAGHGCCTRGRS